MADRIAILQRGGILAQYDTPDAILAAPASEFVARFVGADRGLKRLSLGRVRDLPLATPTTARVGEARASCGGAWTKRPGSTSCCSTMRIARSAGSSAAISLATAA